MKLDRLKIQGKLIFVQKKELLQIPYINIHTHNFNQSVDEITIRNVFAHNIPRHDSGDGLISVGIHPWHINKKDIDDQLAIVESSSTHEKVIAIGEVGLDRITGTPFELQKEIFIKQLHIANRVTKPVVIHCVKAHSDIISIVKAMNFKGKIIFHGFNQNKDIASQLLNQGFYISFGHALLNEESNASHLFAKIDDDRFFLETDDSDIGIKKIYERAAILKNMDVDTVRKIVLDNFNHSFKHDF